MTGEESIPEPPDVPPLPDHPLLDGSWERNGRSLNTAAIVALLGIGALYFNAQSIIMTVVIVAGQVLLGSHSFAGTTIERLTAFMRMFAFPIQLIVFITQYLFILLPVLWLIKRWHTREVRQYIRLKNAAVPEIILAVVATVLLMPASNWIAAKLLESLHIPEEFLKINNELFTAHSPGGLVWLILVICVTPAICEETFFRGYIQRTFERTMGWKSLVLAGVLFGLYHFQPLGLISLSMMGILFGYFYYRSKSLIPGMAAHFTNNFISILMLYLSVHAPDADDISAAGHIPFWIIAATLPLEAAVLFIYSKVTAGRVNA